MQNRLGLEACIGHKYLAPPLLGRGHAHFFDFFGLKYRFYAILGHLEHFCSLLVSFGQFWSLLATYGLAAASEVDELMSRRSQVKSHPFCSPSNLFLFLSFFFHSFFLSFSFSLFSASVFLTSSLSVTHFTG